MTTKRTNLSQLLARTGGALTLAVLALWPAAADDRQLLRTSSGNPYVFFLLDTSGSMNWSPPCTATQAANDLEPGDSGCTRACNFGDLCDALCPDVGCTERDSGGACISTGHVCIQPICASRDCFVANNADDPSSKFFQAKEALYEVLQQVDDVNFGFATYNQDGLYAASKHWRYAADEPGPVVPGWGAFPATGEVDVFGRQWNCDSGNGDNNIGCYPNNDNPADLNDAWERARVGRLPKGGIDLSQTQTFFIRNSNVVYRVSYVREFGTLGDAEIDVRIRIWRCNETGNTTACDSGANRTLVAEKVVEYDLVSEFVSWDNGVDRTAPQDGYWPQTNNGAPYASDSIAGGTCAGWDPNTDTTADRFSGYSLRFPTVAGPPAFTPYLDEGDVIPLSWTQDNKQRILQRLAPSTSAGGDPDFRQSSYLRNVPNSGESFLRLKNEGRRPFIANGSTPLGFAIAAFRTWYAGCEQGSCQGQTGWKDIAEDNDPSWTCRRKYLIVVTDGDDTCPGRDPCSFTAALRAQENVFTYVVAFGVENTSGNRLNCMASNGGTEAPIYPQNKDELVQVLTDIFGAIKEESRAFASAAVPSVQAEVEDKIFLSNFTPLNGESVWDGHLNAFLKPLPLLNNRPDVTKDCATLPADEQASCHIWDAGEQLIEQAPTPDEILADNYRLGPAVDQRRVFYSRAKSPATNATPQDRQFLEHPTNAALRQDLWDALGLAYDLTDLTTNGSTPELKATEIIEKTLVEKTADVEDADGNTIPITYVLGDIFHSNPRVLDKPGDFTAFSGNLPEGNPSGTLDCNTSKGYRCFAQKHNLRRKMVVVGANDGMLHFFDAGVFNSSTEKFSNGTGRELMAVLPRAAMPVVTALATGTTQVFAMDGSPRVIDAFIDPKWDNTTPPDEDEREWRSVLIAGMREGGLKNTGSPTTITLANNKPFTSGYIALDVTQPDKLNEDNEPINQNVVPTCITEYNEDDCGPVPYGATIWEFTDSVNGSPAEWGLALDEDDNGQPDLGYTWSVPVIGQIPVLSLAGDLEKRSVAIFGGGLDPTSTANPQRGNWLYIVDIETGVPIYKRSVLGAVPSNVAAVDQNRDTLIDTVYFGTTAGYLYKVDLSTSGQLAATQARDVNDTMNDVVRVLDTAWSPFIVFDTVTGASTRRPIFFAPTVVNVTQLSSYGLAFGTGDRNDLWNFETVEGRFYFIVDENFVAGMTPRTEANYTIIDSEAAAAGSSDFVISPLPTKSRGWVVTLDPDERVIAQAFSLSGLTIFPTFQPLVETVPGPNGEVACARTGDSRVFIVASNNGDGLLPPLDNPTGPTERALQVGEALVTAPYVEQRATKNPGDDTISPTRIAWEKVVRDRLKKLYPPRARFGNLSWDVSFIRSDTGVVGPIPIPIGFVVNSWKEF